MVEAAYNKKIGQGRGNGTLIGNWQEERDMRLFTGEGRTVPREHIPKKHLDFENPIITDKVFDHTSNRVYGESRPEIMSTNNHLYGTGKNSADGIATIGRKTKNIEREIAMKVAQEMAEKEARFDAKQQERYFDTTTGDTHTTQDLSHNTVGRRVMKTQDGQKADGVANDNLSKVESGYAMPSQKQTDAELRRRMPKGDFHVTRPVTIYTEALERKNTYMSAATGPNPFSRTSGFTQPLNQTKAVVQYEGNVDFAKEKSSVDFFRTQGADLTMTNPYMTKHIQISNFAEIKQKVIDLCRQRSANGLRGLRILFRAMDRNKNGSLDPKEFKYGMRDFGLDLSEIEVTQIVKHFDSNRDGKLSFDEFLRNIRGDMNARRTAMVHMAYNVLDKDGSGQVTIADIEMAYDVSFHPDFQSGIKSKEEILLEFMGVWETQKKDGIVTIEEFEDYYKDISASIDDDDYFELMIRNAWHIAGGEGACENTSIKRVLRTNPDGSQEVVMVENDMDPKVRAQAGQGYGGMEI